MMIHVQYAHPTRTAMMCPRWLRLCTVFTKSIILKCSFCHGRIATPQYVWWSTSRSKCRKAKCRQGKYGQYYSNQNVNTAIDVTKRNYCWINGPNTSTWNTKKHIKTECIRKSSIQQQVEIKLQKIPLQLTQWHKRKYT